VIKVGVLELQGGYALHHSLLKSIGLRSMAVKTVDHLSQVQGLILPGGESTTMSLLMKNYNFRESIIKFANHNPVLGTCAGLILMCQDVNDKRLEPIGLLDVSISRNGYGRQIHSSKKKIHVSIDQENKMEIASTFIRAPIIQHIGKNIDIIAKQDNQPVAILSKNHLGLTFHPEIDNIGIFHKMMFDSSSKFYFKKLKYGHATQNSF
tara:strand:+ start:180 stop:803 length:624 start_codon:yes stop_codon:yes gene_type:complete